MCSCRRLLLLSGMLAVLVASSMAQADNTTCANADYIFQESGLGHDRRRRQSSSRRA